MEFTIRNMMEQDKQEVLDMMRVFYASPAVQSNGSDEIFENDIRTCIEGSPYLEGYVFENEGQLLGYAMAAKSYADVVVRLEVEEENERAVHVYKKAGYEVLPYMEMIRK